MELWSPTISNESKGVEAKRTILKWKIIRVLYTEGYQISASLSKRLHLSFPTIQSLLNELIRDGLVEVRGLGESSGGRKPLLYGLASASFYTLGVDVGRYRIRSALFNHSNTLVSEIFDEKIKLIDEDENILDKICALIHKTIISVGVDKKRIIGIGINMPGLVDSEKGINYTFLTQYNSLPDELEKRLGIKVFLENDARARASAENKFGLAINKQNVLVLHIDWGLGLGMILNGTVYRGHSGFAGEFSHIQVDEQGLLCACGKRGCLETVASGMAMVNQLKVGIASGIPTMLISSERLDTKEITIETIVESILKGDGYALGLVNQMAHNLGKGIASLVQILNPELIIISGRLSRLGDLLILPIKQALYLHCLPKLTEGIEIKVSLLGEEADMLGAISVVTDTIIN